jgi:hypothetical protein
MALCSYDVRRMARKKHDHALDPAGDDAEEPAAQFDSTFEEAQQILQDAVAQIRAWQPSPEYADAHGTAEELGAHRRWRRRMHTDTGEHEAVEIAAEPVAPDPDTAPATAPTPVAELDADGLDAEPAEPAEPADPEPVDADLVDPQPVDPEPVDADLVDPEPVDPEPVDAAIVDEVADPEAVGKAPADAAAADAGSTAVLALVAADSAEDDDAPATSGAATGDPTGQDAESGSPNGDEPGQSRRWRRRVAASAAAAAAVDGADAAGAGDELTDLGTTYERRTPPRRREHASHLATIDSPTADYVLTIESVEPLGPASDAPAPSSTGRRRGLLVAALVAALVVAGIGVALVAGGGNDEVASPPASVKPRLVFPAETTPEGMQVRRVWKLQGHQGSAFVGTLAFTNPTSSPVTTTYTEVIPKSLASSVTSVRFAPPPVVVQADPVVQWTETLAPGQSAIVTYEVTVAADGATRQRLLQWQQDRAAALDTATTTTTTTAPPPTTTTTPTTTPTTAVKAPPATAPSTTTTTAPPTTTTAPPPPQGQIWVSVENSGQAPATFQFSNGITISNVAPQGQGSSTYVAVDAGVHPVTLTNGTATDIVCSNGRTTTSGNTANYDVAPGETVGCTWTASVAAGP